MSVPTFPPYKDKEIPPSVIEVFILMFRVSLYHRSSPILRGGI